MNIVTLGAIASLQSGYQAKSRILQNPKGKYRLVQGSDFDEMQVLNMQSVMTFDPERQPELYAVRKDDILFQARGTTHFAYHVQEELGNSLASTSFYIIRIHDSTVLPGYLAWYLNQSRAQEYYQTHAQGTVVSFVQKSVLMNLEIRVPPVVVQMKIWQLDTLRKRERELMERLAVCRSRIVSLVGEKSIIG